MSLKSELSETVDHLNFWEHKIRMNGLEKIRQAVGVEKSTVNYGPRGQTYLNLQGKSIRVLPSDTVDDIKAKIRANPFERNPNMVSKLQSVASRLGQLKHDCEHDADKLLTRVDGTFARKDAAFAKSHRFLDSQERDLADVEGFIAEIEQATNGAPE